MSAVPSAEREAAHRLYERHHRSIQAFCRHRLGNREEAEDATQITFLNAYRSLKRGMSPQFEAAWLFKIAHNVCLTKQRSSYRRRLVEIPSDLDLVEERTPARETETDELFGLQSALRMLPEQQRRALLLREWQGLTYREIAEEMQTSQSAIETLIFRARRSLADALTSDPHAKPKRARPRTTSNMGSLVAALKSLLLGGGVKVAATVATVATTSVVATTPAVRNDVVHALSLSGPPIEAPAHVRVAAETHPVSPAAALLPAEHVSTARPAVVTVRATHEGARKAIRHTAPAPRPAKKPVKVSRAAPVEEPQASTPPTVLHSAPVATAPPAAATPPPATTPPPAQTAPPPTTGSDPPPQPPTQDVVSPPASPIAPRVSTPPTATAPAPTTPTVTVTTPTPASSRKDKKNAVAADPPPTTTPDATPTTPAPTEAPPPTPPANAAAAPQTPSDPSAAEPPGQLRKDGGDEQPHGHH